MALRVRKVQQPSCFLFPRVYAHNSAWCG